MKRALIYASVASMIQQFNMDNIQLLLSLGFEVDVACNMKQGSTVPIEQITLMKQELKAAGVNVFHFPVPRKVTAVVDILRSLQQTKDLINNRQYTLIHCHSPIGGMICRLANRLSKNYGKNKMIYTAHGFHFFKGAPKLNWLLFYPIEWFCSRYTDVLITINQEDYNLAKNKMNAKQTVYVPGVGVNLEKIKNVQRNREALCISLGLTPGDVLMLSVGELNDNKNHRAVIEILDQLPSNCHYLICGQGNNRQMLENLAQERGCVNRVHFLGYRDDVLSVMKSCDCFVFPSKREGLPVALMEAMAVGKAVACSEIRGNIDLVDDNGGVLFKPRSADSCAAAIGKLLKSDMLTMGKYNAAKICAFSRETVNEIMVEIYRSQMIGKTS